jgi:hypothetical protein
MTLPMKIVNDKGARLCKQFVCLRIVVVFTNFRIGGNEMRKK